MGKSRLIVQLRVTATLTLAVLIACLGVVPSFAEQAGPAAPADGVNQALLDRINQLEAKVKQLEEKQTAPAPTLLTARPFMSVVGTLS